MRSPMPAQFSEPTSFSGSNPPSHVRWLKIVLIAMAIMLGFCQVWAGRNALFVGDSLQYIESGEAYLRGDWSAAINPYWSPLYCWLLGAGLKFLRPSAYWEFPAVQFINFIIYLATMGCFHFFLINLIRYCRVRRAREQESGWAEIPESAWWALGYTLFILTSLEMITITISTPDMCVAAFVYLASGIVLRLHTETRTGKTCFLLGICLGFGYLAKAAMLPVSLAFILAGLTPRAGFPKTLVRALTALAGLALIATPYIAILSKRVGRLTYSETPKLVYMWEVNGVAGVNGAVDATGFGKPLHPVRQIFTYPRTFESGSPVPGTWPSWYNPVYWCEGMTPHFVLRQQLAALGNNLYRLAGLFLSEAGTALLVAISFLYLFSASWRAALRNLAAQWFLLLPPLAAFAMYSLVLIQPRYVGAYFCVFWAGLISGLCMPASPQSRKILTSVTIAVVVVSLAVIVHSTVRNFVKGPGVETREWPQVAQYLSRTGLRSGDAVGVITAPRGYFVLGWARTARVRVTAEMEWLEDFLSVDDETKSKALDAMFRTGVKAIVANQRLASGCSTGWRNVEGFSICLAPPPKSKS